MITFKQYTEDIKVPIKVGDTVLGGRFKNKKIKVNNLNIKVSFKFVRLFKIIFKLLKIFKKNPYTLTHFFLPQAYILGMASSIIANTKCKLIMSRRSLNFYQNKLKNN